MECECSVSKCRCVLYLQVLSVCVLGFLCYGCLHLKQTLKFEGFFIFFYIPVLQLFYVSKKSFNWFILNKIFFYLEIIGGKKVDRGWNYKSKIQKDHTSSIKCVLLFILICISICLRIFLVFLCAWNTLDVK